MAIQRGLVVGVGVAEQLAEPLRVVLRRVDQPVVVIVPDLVAEMAEQRAVGLVHRDPQLLAVHVVALGEVQGDHAVVVAGEHLLVLTGQQVERQAVLRVLVAADDRQLQLVQFDDQPALGLLGGRECGQRLGVVVVGAGPGQRARPA